MTAPLLTVRDLVKTFGRLRAVDGLGFEIPAGVCFGLLGPNGAGKTTTIEMIEGITKPTSGEILFEGKPRTPAFWHRVGIQFQHTSLLDFQTVGETLATYASLFPRAADLAELSRRCDLDDIRDRYTQRLSGGQRQRLLVALALVNDPLLVFLDEPSTGLDPQARRHLWDIIEDIRADGRTVILTTHYMEEARRLCDDIAIMDQGKVIARGGPDDLIRAHCGGTILRLPLDGLTCPFADLPEGAVASRDEVVLETGDMSATLGRLLECGVNLNRVSIHAPDLEDVFLTLTGRRLRD